MPNEPGQSVVTPPTEVTPIDPDQVETVTTDTTTDDLSQLKSLEDKLTYTLGTKTAIKNAIEAKGVTVPEGTVFRDYAAKIGEIESVPVIELASLTVERLTYGVSYQDGFYIPIKIGRNSSGQVIKGSKVVFTDMTVVAQASGDIENLGLGSLGSMDGQIFIVNGDGSISSDAIGSN